MIATPHDPRHVHNPEGINYDPTQIAFESPQVSLTQTIPASITNKSLRRYLELLPEPSRSNIAYCFLSEDWDSYECGVCGRLVHRPVSSCKDHYCPVCATFYALNKAMKTYDRLKPFYKINGSEKSGAFIKSVYTIPDKFWSEISDHKSMDRLVRCSVRAEKEFLSKMARKDFASRGLFKRGEIGLNEKIQLGHLVFIHTWDKDLTWRPHVEVISPNLAFVGAEHRPFRFKYHRSKSDLATQSEIWLSCLRAEFGWDIDVAVVHYGFALKEHQVVHRLKYGLRPPLGDDPNPDPELLLNHFTFRENYRVQRWYGFLSTVHIKRSRSSVIGSDPDGSPSDLSEDDKSSQSKQLPCPNPLCPGFLVYLGRFSTSEVLKLHQDRGLDPPRYVYQIATIRNGATCARQT